MSCLVYTKRRQSTSRTSKEKTRQRLNTCSTNRQTLCTHMYTHMQNKIVICPQDVPSFFIFRITQQRTLVACTQNSDCPWKLRERPLACFLQSNIFHTPCSAHTNDPSQAGQVWSVRGSRGRWDEKRKWCFSLFHTLCGQLSRNSWIHCGLPLWYSLR